MDIDDGRCHVEQRIVPVQITKNERAVFLAPLSFAEGPGINAWPASAGIRIMGDTLEVSGFAPTDCTRLAPVAYRLSIGIHVQIEPSTTPLERCGSPRQFQVRYLLPRGEGISLLVTNGTAYRSCSSTEAFGPN